MAASDTLGEGGQVYTAYMVEERPPLNELMVAAKTGGTVTFTLKDQTTGVVTKKVAIIQEVFPPERFFGEFIVEAMFKGFKWVTYIHLKCMDRETGELLLPT